MLRRFRVTRLLLLEATQPLVQDTDGSLCRAGTLGLWQRRQSAAGDDRQPTNHRDAADTRRQKDEPQTCAYRL